MEKNCHINPYSSYFENAVGLAKNSHNQINGAKKVSTSFWYKKEPWTWARAANDSNWKFFFESSLVYRFPHIGISHFVLFYIKKWGHKLRSSTELAYVPYWLQPIDFLIVLVQSNVAIGVQFVCIVELKLKNEHWMDNCQNATCWSTLPHFYFSLSFFREKLIFGPNKPYIPIIFASCFQLEFINYGCKAWGFSFLTQKS